jgi:hypothetical protein
VQVRHDHHERAWQHEAQALERRPVPEQQQPEPQQRDDHGAGLDAVEHSTQRREGGFLVGLPEGEVAFGVGIVPERMRHLLEDEDEADRGQHPLDHRRGK